MNSNKYPKDLASVVFSEIKRKNSKVPSEEILTSLFEIMYFSSIKTEESEPIIFNIVYLDLNNPDPNPPERSIEDRWRIVKLSDKIQFNLPNVIKLAKASDPRTSSLAIFHNDKDELFIWGLVDQGNRYHDFVNYESEEGPERPGVFQASLEGPGNIVSYIQYEKIAELRVNHIVRRTIDVFKQGPIREALQMGIDGSLKSVIENVSLEAYENRENWDTLITEYWFSTICRLILRIKTYGHGGAILFSNIRLERGLNVKYPTTYNRLKNAVINRNTNLIESTYESDQIFEFIDNEEDIPLELYLEESASKENLKNIRSEIDGSLWFISLLSRVDGLVLLNKRLVVRGFGVEIKSAQTPENIFKCSTQIPRDHALEEVDYNHFGTRHRSMMRYCWHYENAVGFVISQDGDVRAMTKHKNKLLIWDNIKLQAYTFVRRRLLRKRKLLRKK